VLLLVVVGLGAFIWFFERDLPGSDERALQAKRVLAFEADEVTEIVVERGDTRVHLERPEETEEESSEDSGTASVKREWRLLEPYDARADTPGADRLADSLALLEKERTLEDVDRAAVGLETPRATVTVITADSEATLEVGSEIPASTNMVVARGADTFVVPASIWELLSRDGGDWRSPELFPLHRGAVDRIDLESIAAGRGRVGLVKRDDDSYWMDAPFEDRADKTRIDELLDAMFRLQVGDYLDEPQQSLTEMGLEPPTATLAVSFVGREQPYSVDLGLPTPDGSGERFARVEGQVMTLGGDLDKALARPASEWQESGWTAFEVFEIDSFRVLSDGGELLLERAGSDWARDGETIAYEPVSNLLYALTGVAGERVVDRETTVGMGADLTSTTLEIELKGKEREERLLLYESESGALAGSGDRQHWLVLSVGTVEDLRVKLQAIRDQPVLSAEPDVDSEN
jgi:hypothetical protein